MIESMHISQRHFQKMQQAFTALLVVFGARWAQGTTKVALINIYRLTTAQFDNKTPLTDELLWVLSHILLLPVPHFEMPYNKKNNNLFKFHHCQILSLKSISLGCYVFKISRAEGLLKMVDGEPVVSCAIYDGQRAPNMVECPVTSGVSILDQIWDMILWDNVSRFSLAVKPRRTLCTLWDHEKLDEMSLLA